MKLVIVFLAYYFIEIATSSFLEWVPNDVPEMVLLDWKLNGKVNYATCTGSLAQLDHKLVIITDAYCATAGGVKTSLKLELYAVASNGQLFKISNRDIVVQDYYRTKLIHQLTDKTTGETYKEYCQKHDIALIRVKESTKNLPAGFHLPDKDQESINGTSGTTVDVEHSKTDQLVTITNDHRSFIVSEPPAEKMVVFEEHNHSEPYNQCEGMMEPYYKHYGCEWIPHSWICISAQLRASRHGSAYYVRKDGRRILHGQYSSIHYPAQIPDSQELRLYTNIAHYLPWIRNNA